MQKYLNRRNKSLVIQLGYIPELSEKAIQSLKLDGDLKKRMRTVATNARKSFESIVKGLSADEAKALQKTLAHTELTVTQKTQVVVDTKDFEEQQDLFFEIIDTAQERCRQCPEGEELVKNCLLKKAFLRYEIPVYDDENEDWECPFKNRRYRK